MPWVVTVMSLPRRILGKVDAIVHVSESETQVAAASLRVQSIVNEIAESYARIQGRDEPPPADRCGLMGMIHSRKRPAPPAPR